MQISNLFKIQKEANSKLVIDTTLSEYKLFARKHLQLQIKMSELANETKCYKYWLNDDSILDKNIIFQKYIACLKQILSLGLDNNYDSVEEVTLQPSEYCLSDQFLNLYIDINDLIISPSKDHFITLIEDYFSLGISLGFSEEIILDGFYNFRNIQIAL
ncbi:dUTP diphosphatase [Clostridium paraputrificum]|uniref:dUTP diphosphatase n=1 Tax=Clostridium TaxID=1485 RepID=UPI003D349AA7